jgi:hypothetical protein
VDVFEAITAAVRKVDDKRRLEITDCSGVRLCTSGDVPRVVFREPEEFDAAFQAIAGAKYGNPELIQVYLKRGNLQTPEGPVPAYVAEFAIPR